MEDLEAHHFSLSLVSLLIRSTTKGDNEHVSVPHIHAKYGADHHHNWTNFSAQALPVITKIVVCNG